jgi:flagellar basal body-associated protein FliL
MKKPVLFAGIGLVLAAGGAFMAAAVTKPPEPKIDWRSKRGTDEYYKECEPQNYELKDLNVNIKGSNGERYLTVGLAVQYRLGAELMNPPDKAPVDYKAPFETAKLEISDRLTLLLSNKTLPELEGREKQNVLKQEIMEEVSAAVFPDQMGRVDKIFINKLLVQ